MQRILAFVVLALGSLTWNAGTRALAQASGDKKDLGKGVVVDLDGLHARTPAEWKQEKAGGSLRWMQFRLPRVEGDKEDAELVIFKGLGGSAQANIERWKQQFQNGAAEVHELTIGGEKAIYLDVHGIYLSRDLRNPTAKTEKQPDYRMLAVHYEGKSNPYHFKLVGPAKTVGHYKKGFDEWLKAFK